MLNHKGAKMWEDVSSYLPQVQPNHANAVIFVDLGIGGVLGVVDLWVDPLALVGRVVDLPGLPLALRKGDSPKKNNHTKLTFNCSAVH